MTSHIRVEMRMLRSEKECLQCSNLRWVAVQVKCRASWERVVKEEKVKGSRKGGKEERASNIKYS